MKDISVNYWLSSIATIQEKGTTSSFEALTRYQQSVYIFEVLNGLKSAPLGLIVSAATTILPAFCNASSLKELLSANGTSIGSWISSINWTSIILFFLSVCPSKVEMESHPSHGIDRNRRLCLGDVSYHTLHGAFPDAQSSSNSFFSLCVSMHCQNPW